MTRRSYAAALIDPRERVLQRPRQNWFVQGALIVFAVTVGSVAVMAIAFGILNVAARWFDGAVP